MADDRQVVEDAYAAFARGDIDAVIATFDDAIQWNVPASLPWGGRHVGPDAVVQNVFGPALALFDGFTSRPDCFLQDGDTVVVLGTFGGTAKATGRELVASFAHIWKMRDGKAVRHDGLTDTAAWLSALGDEGDDAEAGDRPLGYPRRG